VVLALRPEGRTAMTMSFEQFAMLTVVSGISGLVGIASLVFMAIQTFRRRPPIEAQFADSKQNHEDHIAIHRRISDLRDESDKKFVLKEHCVVAEKMTLQFRSDLKQSVERVESDIRRVDKNVTALATKLGVEVLDL
jgi:hypothetical protein